MAATTTTRNTGDAMNARQSAIHRRLREWKAGPALLLAALLVVLPSCGKEEKPKGPSLQPAMQGPPGRSAPEAAELEQALLARLANNPEDMKAQLQLANLYYDTGRPQLAAPAYRAVLEQQPDNPSVRTDLGTCYKRMGELGEARTEYETVIRKHPGHIQATFNLGVVCELLGDHAKAAEHWERVGAMAPGTPVARQALRFAAEARAALADSKKRAPQTPVKEPTK
jgi:Flp pilus assembly protein TadD